MSTKNSPLPTTKPYLIRALYEWCTDNGFTPYLSVKVQGQVKVPMEYVRNGEIVLNIAFGATTAMQMDNEAISFKARFNGVSRDIYVPIQNIAAIYASENGQGMGFDVDAELAAISVTAQESREDNVVESDKPTFTIAISTEPEVVAEDSTKTKENRKKPSFTVIK